MPGNGAHWSEFIMAHGSLSEATCMTWVRDVDPIEMLRRLGGQEPFPMRYLYEIDHEIGDLYNTDSEMPLWEPIGAIACQISDNWALLVEPNGWAGTMAADLAEISAGTEAVSIFWNVNALSEIAISRDRQAVAVISDVIMFAGDGKNPQCSLENVYGNDPGLVKDLVTEINELPDLVWKPAAFRWAEKYTGAAIPVGLLDQSHPSTVFTKNRR